MNKRSEYNKIGMIIIASAVLFSILVIGLFANHMTGFASRVIRQEIIPNESVIEQPMELTPVETPEIQVVTPEQSPAQIQSTCVTPYEDMVINTSITLCGGTYHLTDGEDDGAIIIQKANNIIISCDNTLIVGDGSGVGIMAQGGSWGWRNNITIIGCSVSNYRSNIVLQYFYNSSFINLTSSYADKENMFVQYAKNIIIDHLNSSYSQHETYGHGLYLSASTTANNSLNNITIKNSYFYNNSASSIAINGINNTWVFNVSIYNNFIFASEPKNGGYIAINDFGCRYCNIYNNIINGGSSGIRLSRDSMYPKSEAYSGSKDNIIHDNTFIDNYWYNILIVSGSTGNKIYNNTYINNNENQEGNPSIWIEDQPEYEVNAYIEESHTPEFNVKYDRWYNDTITSNAAAYFNYSGHTRLFVQNNSISLTDQSQNSPFNDVKNSSNDVILASNVDNFTITLQPNQQIEVGDFVDDNANHPPTITVALSDQLNCSTIASDQDNNATTTMIEWYYNNTLNRTINATSDLQENWTGTHYCKARAYDGEDYSEWVTSNTVHIGYTAPTVSASLNNDLECEGTVNKEVNITIMFYKNDVLKDTDTITTSDTYSDSTSRSAGRWYCEANASDSITTITAISNNITITETKRGGGGGGSTPISNHTNITVEPKIILNVTTNVTNTTTETSATIVAPVTTQSVVETPNDLAGQSYLTSLAQRNALPISTVIIVSIIIIIIVIRTVKPQKVDQNILDYIIKAVHLGYDYKAIRNALSKKVSNEVIDHHFYILRRHDLKPIQKPKRVIPINDDSRKKICDYIEQQKSQGFTEKDIKKVLLMNGYPKELID